MVSRYEFVADGACMVMAKGMEQPISGYYRWIGKRTLELHYKETYTAIK